MTAAAIDRRAMGRLSLGHGCADLCQGAVPALLPALIAHRGLSLASATALVSIATIGSSVVQPLFGLWADRLSTPRLAPIGVAIGALGLGAVGLCHSYLALAVALAVSGLGVALFHPEGARMAGAVAGGSARGMSYFSIGGNVGFAVGPALVLLVLAIGGLDAAPLLALPGLAVAALLARELPRIAPAAAAAAPTRAGTPTTATPAAWGPFTRLAGAAVSRTAAFFALQAFVPLYLVQQLGTGDGVGTLALVAMLAAGALGTLIGGRCADRFGRRVVLVWAMLPLALLLAALPHVGLALFLVLLLGVGLTVDGPFATTVVLGHEYLPGRTGLSSGITLGLAIGLGGLLATGLGALADATSLHTALLTLPVFAVAALGLALSLPDPPRALARPS
ncbi:MFS transporter [Patulibacter defluvii]|uniref:MFS transporter n=1 Tax=Patulibacter defluvii TaxID=3095358 RepID=UPI002A758BB2|nr:MFS transporter [Patulibacter sp. DM4]